jgi:hypothetical protein
LPSQRSLNLCRAVIFFIKAATLHIPYPCGYV